VLIVTNGAVDNSLAVHRYGRRQAVATRTQFVSVHHLFGSQLPQSLNQSAINHGCFLSFCPLALSRQGGLVRKNPNLPFPFALFTQV
jgi:hypothetical protein